MRPCDAVLLNQIDRDVATKVMGIDLKPHRDVALVAIGWRHIAATGDVFSLRTGDELLMPPRETLRKPEGARDYNSYYACFVADFLAAKCPEIAAEVEAYRVTPRPYSTDLAAAFEVVEHLETEWEETSHPRLPYWRLVSRGRMGRWSVGVYSPYSTEPIVCRIAAALPRAICRVALDWHCFCSLP